MNTRTSEGVLQFFTGRFSRINLLIGCSLCLLLLSRPRIRAVDLYHSQRASSLTGLSHYLLHFYSLPYPVIASNTGARGEQGI